jgi:hypothetical protein
LSLHKGRLSFRFNSGWAEPATKLGFEWTPVQREAIKEVRRLSHDEDFVLDMSFQPGDIQYLNNYAVLHSRSEFTDYPEMERRRFLLRIWLRAHMGRDLPDSFDQVFGPYPTREGIHEHPGLRGTAPQGYSLF